MQGLNAPRGITIGPDGAIYVAESGSAFNTDTAEFVVVRGTYFYYGETGSISKWEGGVQSTVFSGLPTLYAPSIDEAVGPSDLAFSPEGDFYLSIGMGLDLVQRTGAMVNLGRILHIPAGGTTPSTFADIAQYEEEHNPDGVEEDVHSNPFRLVAKNGGGFYVIDSGANALLSVSSLGVISTHAVFPRLGSGQQSVPTGLALRDDGRIFVGELTGFPYLHGAARIFSIEDGEVEVIGDGFTHIIDLALADDGTLFVLEHNSDSLMNPLGLGALYAFDPVTNSRTLLLDELIAPTGLATDGFSTIYLSHQGHGDGKGEVIALTYAAVPEPQTWAMVMASGVMVWQLRRRRDQPL